MTDIHGAFIEIVERRKRPDHGTFGAELVVPNEVRINGQRIAIPSDEPITVHEMSRDDVVKVTLTVFARRIFVGHEDVDDEVLQGVVKAQTALAAAQSRAVQAQAEYLTAVDQARRDLAEVNRKLAEATHE
jgi:hypothetical protein